MKKVKFVLMALVAAIVVSCGTTRTVPITGRKQNILVSDEQVLSLSNQEYSDYMKSAKLSTNAANTAMVKRVGQKLATAVEAYLNNHGLAAETKQYSWEFNLVQDKSANAFCMPGGKIVVYEGLLPYTQNEASLAIVLGHEIAHAVAKHSAEQMSKQIKNQYGTQILGSVLNAAGVSSSTTQLAQIIAQKGLQFRSLKYSRDNETEADRMGLIFAAMAGYDPNVAVSFWQRMSQGNNSNQSDMFSDHPSDAKRIAAIKQELPEALTYYNPPKTTVKKTTTTKKKTVRKTTARRK
ncbi:MULTISPECIES: M48 family metallopeptidase [Prevotellaceae]|jgi:predicted Zn-dependent protease|uniref:M48 family metallopeptidase n=1 Tax=Leyella stercorea TaxID=363265 RepID=UPI001F221D96|nr:MULTISPECIES: M48 family metallopeptidase [Prevotellaceae]MCF2644798.1 M48 family metallopeptidase [Leyella stercorea]MCI6129447.1 M48 family metallopeptidase [Prevotella sp.]MCI7371919.1 M48 family metallopeptidase [Prevotella sp.]MDD6198150.1 M48 family metallopeptidase [Prevotella sp.]MDY3966862.1 M48 family metallopeptidase [Prevotella sp.]